MGVGRIWHEGCSFLIPALEDKVIRYDTEQASHFPFPGYRLPCSRHELYHPEKMSSFYGENNPFYKSRLPELSDNYDTSQHYLVSRSFMSHCLICKIPYFNGNIESPLILVTARSCPQNWERKLLYSFNFRLWTKMTIYQTVFNAAFGTNTNKNDPVSSPVALHSTTLFGVLNPKTWTDMPYNTEEKHGIWTQTDLSSNLCSAIQ